MKKKVNRKANLYANGSFKWQKGAGFGTNMKNAWQADALNPLISTVGGIGGLVIGGGLQSNVGNAMQGLSSIAGAIPGPWGAAAGAALNVVGGLTNRMFGSNINEQAVKGFESANQLLANMQFGANNTSDLLALSNFGILGHINRSDVGSDGWFSNKAKNLANKLNAERELANLMAMSNYNTAVLNLDLQNDLLAMLNMTTPNITAYGGSIHIKKANRGKFTESANKAGMGVQEYARHILANKDDYSTLLIRRATFARNFRGNKKAGGGLLGEDNLYYKYIEPETTEGVLGKLALQLADPTGITSYPDLSHSFWNMVDNPTLENFKELRLNAVSSLPMIGKLTTPFKAAKAAKITSKLNKEGKVARSLTKAADVNKYIDTLPEVIPGIRPLAKGTLDFTSTVISDPIFNIFKRRNKYDIMRDYRLGNHIIDGTNISNTTSDLTGAVKELKNNEKALGGPLMTNGADWSNGLTIIGNGGSHEENPYDGILMGVDEQGVPNLVEEDEVVWNDYVFSNRLKPTEQMRKQYKLKGKTFADAVKYLLKESEERPNDPISLRSLDTMLSKIAFMQETIRKKKESNKFKCGGKMFDDGGPIKSSALETWYSDPNNYDLDPIKGITLTFNFGDNSEEKRMSFYPTYNLFKSNLNRADFDAFWKNEEDLDRIKNTKIDWSKVALPIKINHDLQYRSTQELPLSKNTIRLNPQDLASDEDLGLNTTDYNPYGDRNDLLKVNKQTLPDILNEDVEDSIGLPFKSSPLRFAPAVANAVSLTLNIFSKPDYRGADSLMEEANRIGQYTPVIAERVGNYMTYNPLDRNYLMNKANMLTNAARRAIINNAGGNRAAAMAGLIGNNYAALNALADAFIKMDETNEARRNKALAFNNDIDRYNADAAFKAAITNREGQAKANAARAELVGKSLVMRDAIDALRALSLSANISGLAESLGNIGMDITNRNMTKWLVDKDVYGKVKAANGGKIRRRKKGLTY